MLNLLDNAEKHIHILQTSSTRAELYVEDRIKERALAGSENIIRIVDKNSVSQALDTVGFEPREGGKWVVIVEKEKTPRLGKELENLIKANYPTVLFLLKAPNYKTFKSLRQKFPEGNDCYLSSLNYSDLKTLLGNFLTPKLLGYTYNSYRSSPDKVFQLYESFLQNTRITSVKDITEICGISEGSIEAFIFSFFRLPEVKTSVKERTVKKRFQIFCELLAIHGVSVVYYTCRNILVDIFELKSLYLNGKIYKKIEHLPEGYDEQKLLRYQRSFSKIMGIPLERIIQLYQILNNNNEVWHSELDAFTFFYKAVKELC